jgi:hypothetical protein
LITFTINKGRWRGRKDEVDSGKSHSSPPSTGHLSVVSV